MKKSVSAFLVPALLVLSAVLSFAGCAERQENDEGDGPYPDGYLKNASEVHFETEAELVKFLADEKQVSDFEKEQIPVYGYYYRLKNLPFKASNIVIVYNQDEVEISYFTDDPEFNRQNGDTYTAMLTWNRSLDQAQALLRDAIESGVPPVDHEKSAGGRKVYYGQAEFPSDTEGGPSIFTSGYYFLQDGFFFSVNINQNHSEKNFSYCELEKVQVK